MANIVHPEGVQGWLVARGLARTALFVAGFSAVVAAAGQLV